MKSEITLLAVSFMQMKTIKSRLPFHLNRLNVAQLFYNLYSTPWHFQQDLKRRSALSIQINLKCKWKNRVYIYFFRRRLRRVILTF